MMAMQFDSGSKQPPLDDRRGGDLNRRMTIDHALDSVEVLAGAGDLDHAREMIGKLVAYDEAEATKKQLAERVTRAGQPGLFKNE
jgi:hypothetical protein